MPTYEYKCFACEHAFERFQSIKADPIRRCPECGKRKVRRLLSTGAGLIFKGSGFYITDYRSDGYKKAAKAEAGGGSSSESGSGSGDGKSAAAEGKNSSKSESTPAAAKPAETKPTAGASGGSSAGPPAGSKK